MNLSTVPPRSKMARDSAVKCEESWSNTSSADSVSERRVKSWMSVNRIVSVRAFSPPIPVSLPDDTMVRTSAFGI